MLKTVFWTAGALLVYTHAGYPALLWLLARGRPDPSRRKRSSDADFPGDAELQGDAEPSGDAELQGVGEHRGGAVVPGDASLPSVSLIVAAYDEEAVIGDKVENARTLDYPRDRLEVIVASDGSADRTVERARAAGADLVLDLPRGGKAPAQDAAVERARGDVLAFSDANSRWAPDALRALVRALSAPRVGYACGHVRFTSAGGSNQEGLYWRYETAVRALESRLGSITAGNGAIYAVRAEAYIVVDPRVSHDLALPFAMVKRGWRAVYAPDARAEERMVPSSEGEFRRKRRMMGRVWPLMLGGGMLSPRGYGPLYALQIISHRLLRYSTPFLHVAALVINLALLDDGSVYAVTMAAQLALLAAAAIGPVVPVRPFRVAHYYVLMTASLAAGLWDWLRRGTPAGWEKARGTR